MKYKFETLRLANAEKIWLNELLAQNFSKINIRSLKVKLYEKLPKGFDPNNIDDRLINNKNLSLIGLWYVDPNNLYFHLVTKIIFAIKEMIKENHELSEVRASELSGRVFMDTDSIGIALELIYNIGYFFGGASSKADTHGYYKVSLKKEDNAFDEFLNFESIEKTMEKYFLKHEPLKGNDGKQTEIKDLIFNFSAYQSIYPNSDITI